MRRPLRLIAFCGFATAGFAASDVVISQIYGGGGNAGAQLRNDFIELFNRSQAPLDVTGWSVQYASATGGDWQVTPITGVIHPGRFLLVQEAAGASGTTDLPRPDATGSIAMSATAGKVALVRSTQPLSGAAPASASIVDVAGYGATASFFERAPAPQLSNTTAAFRDAGGCRDTDDNSVDFRTGAPAPRNSEAGAINCSELPPPARAVAISEVQGTGERSPLLTERVSVRGIVTGRKSNGFFIQSLQPDSDPATSEGLFVFTNSAPPADAAAGNVIEVSGTVAEFGEPANTLTELIDPFAFIVVARAVELPPVVQLEPLDSWERHEGMRVYLGELTPVSSAAGFVDERTATARESGIIYGVQPGLERPYRAADDGEAYPWLVRFDGPGAVLEAVTTITDIEGPLDVSGGAWSVRASRANLTSGARRTAEPVVRPAAEEFTIATMNLQRLFDTTDDPSTSDFALTPAAFETRLSRISRVIREILHSPAIIGVQEVENIETLRALGTAIGGYSAFLEEGNDPGGIDVGFLVHPRVQVISVQQIGKSEEFTFGGRNELLWDRPPLVLRARIESSAAFTVVVNHLRSLISGDDPRVVAKRAAQARSLAQFIQQRHAPAEPLAVIGDFNAFPVGEPLSIITGVTPRLLNLTDTLPPDQNYTYIQNGVTQTLDHILVNLPMQRWLTRYMVARVNADAAETLRNDASGLLRISDHDHPVAYFDPEPPTLRPISVSNAGTWRSGAVAPLEIVSIFGTGFTAATTVSFDEVPAAILYRGATQINALVPADLASRSTTNLRVGQGTLTLPVASAAPGLFEPILNQDFSVNSAARPATHGSVVMLWGTGAGTSGPVTAIVGNEPAIVTYANGAPGMPAGVFQVNVRIPGRAPTGDTVPIRIAVRGIPTQRDVSIAVR